MGNARRTVSVDADALATILDILELSEDVLTDDDEHAAYEQLCRDLDRDA